DRTAAARDRSRRRPRRRRGARARAPRVADGAETLHRSQRLTRYHGSGRPSRKNPPVGPSFVNVAAHTTLAAPSATGRPPEPPMSVATQPGQTRSEERRVGTEGRQGEVVV